MNIAASVTQDPLLQGAFAYEISENNQYNTEDQNIIYTRKTEDKLSWYVTHLVPWMSFDLGKFKFSVVGIHALNFFSGWCPQNLIQKSQEKGK